MRRLFLATLLCPTLLLAQGTPIRPHAELKTGTAVEKMEIVGESAAFKVAAGSKIFVWAKVMGAADTTVTFVFTKGDKTSKQALKVPRSPYRTHAYRTFRKGDEGEWTVTLIGDQEAVLGSATFKVELQ
ncbi:MAG: DUF2914 domain-containing protein [Geothrix sp.]|uniref:DUF2914 domain-containing protein n=1 Tax=Geothrix sp. TaxID=1962974 RepID=UPI0018460346|nr:DUF2914 domain-containing protein [Geothrix sp.]NWJ39488.1 DUF2914 domain-containing protein [Geothrix sp.]WIL19289.1 MAG: DUF2914 domain-containing protein [Geothrix sp.]